MTPECSRVPKFRSQMDSDQPQQSGLITAENVEKVFQEVERSYHSTPDGWRLATYEEAKDGIETIKKKKLLKRWDRARLLDGWITGAGYDYEMGDDFKGCLGYMLLIQIPTQASYGPYANVNLTERGKEVALFLCVDDWNYEVAYWLLNSWSNSKIMNVEEVGRGNIPFNNVKKFQEMNKMMGLVARKLGEAGGEALEKSKETIYSGSDSVRELLSGMIRIVTEEEDVVQFMGHAMWKFEGYKGDEYCLPQDVGGCDVGEAFWNFVCDSFAGYVVEVCAFTSFTNIWKMEAEGTSQNKLMIVTSILFHLSDFRTNVIHEPMAHNCKDSCAQKVLLHALKKAAGNSEMINKMLKENAMWRCYDDRGNYDVLDKLLIVVAKGKYHGEKIAATVVNMLLRCGARPGRRLALGKYKNKTVLHSVAKFRDEDIGIKVTETLLRKCNVKSIREFVNATDERGMTALHSASEKGNARIAELLVRHGALVTIKDERERTALHNVSEKGDALFCELLLHHGASVAAQDKKRKTAVHYALEGGKDEVIDVLLNSLHGVPECLDLKDNRGSTPLHIALTKTDHKSAVKLLIQSRDPETYLRTVLAKMNDETTGKLSFRSKEPQAFLDIALPNMDHVLTAKLLLKLEKPEAYFNKVDQEQLLCNSLLLGSVQIVHKLFRNKIKLPDGDCDEAGKTALHLAAMCDNESKAFEIIVSLIDGVATSDLEKMVARRDKKGRTALHEAALKGHAVLCQGLLELNSELIYVKDGDDGSPLHDAAKVQYKKGTLYKKLLDAYLKEDRPKDDLMDRSGLTPLHVAASQGNAKFVKEFLSRDEIVRKYLRRGDILAQTALHKAVKLGDMDTVRILLKHDAHPLRERDCDGKTALHYVLEANSEDKVSLAKMLFEQCESEEEESLLLWASAAGLGTAGKDLSKDDALHKFLVKKKVTLEKNKLLKEMYQGNLLKMAASLGDIEMTKELISRGYQIGDIRDPDWKKTLPPPKLNKVNDVLRQIDKIKEQGNDKPAISDSLGRLDYAQGLAALFLNPYIKPPIAVGITGSWGMGKSSLMVQTERILLTAAAQMALLPNSNLSSSSELPDTKRWKLSRKGKRICDNIYKQIKCEERVNGEKVNANIFVIFWNYIMSRSKSKHAKAREIQEAELMKFLNEYDRKYLKVFKALAAMDSRNMLKTKGWRPKADPSAEENVPAVLTVQYNAWKYRNNTEALAGIAVEITKELEGLMTPAQWLNTCWRNTYEKKKYTLWIEFFFPSLLALVLVCSFTWIVWVFSDSDKLKEWGKAKYAWPPAALVLIVWTLTKSVMGILKPVSTQLMQYISFPDHSDKLGYQERVISDITFLKDEIGKKAYWVFIVFAWVLTTSRILWCLITQSSITSLLFHHEGHEKVIEARKLAPASGSNLRIIVFVDDLDRCEEPVILQILSAINLVLAVCEISVVVGMDKKLITRAIIKKYKNINANESLKAKQELADMYLQKIIQLPLDLPDPSDEESRSFLKGQLGVLENENETSINDDRSSISDDGEREAAQQYAAPQGQINVQIESEITETGPTNLLESINPTEGRRDSSFQTDGDATVTGIQPSPNSPIVIREMLFVRYSQGEEDAFLYFQTLATDCRKLPREWKRLLNYHRLVWYIFSVSNEAKKLVGWQVQLITWIFICWEWKDNMNIIIEKWKESGKSFLTSEPSDTSLLTIVKHLIKELDWESPKKTETSKGEDGPKSTQKVGEAGGSFGVIKNEEEPEKLNEKGESSMLKITDGKENISTDDRANIETASQESADNMKNRFDALEMSLVELKKEMKELRELVADDLKKDLEELKQQLSEELREDIKEVKEQIAKKESGPNAEKSLKKKEFHENWKKMKSTLEKYDVSMNGIQAFQRFRFYCVAGYLPRHSLRG